MDEIIEQDFETYKKEFLKQPTYDGYFKCECGSKIKNYDQNIHIHKKTKKHKKYIAQFLEHI